jgi:hypothetical protein
MIRRLTIYLLLLLISLLPVVRAQDGLNLPTELYILLNEGTVERYGLGMAGVTRVTPQDTFVVDFRVAPDGNWVAYRTPESLMVADMFAENSVRQIEAERAGLPQIRGRGETIAWSPTADALAYTTEYGGRVHFFNENSFSDLTTPDLQHLVWSTDGAYLAAEASGGVWWFFRRNGTSLDLSAAIPGANGGTWFSGSQFLFAAPEGGLILMNLADANRQTPLVAADRIYHLPVVALDGTIRAFAGTAESARLVEIMLTQSSASVNPAGTGDLDLSGMQWAPGGMLLTAFQGGVLALVEPYSGSGFTLPIAGAATFGWGATYPPAAAGLTLPDDGYFLALDNSSVMQVWRLPANGSLPATITPALEDISEFALSIDRTRIAYVSNNTLYHYTLGSNENPQEITGLGSTAEIHPVWSPDGSMIYYRDEQPTGNGIWRATLTGEPELFLADPSGTRYDSPLPAPGVGAMLVAQGEDLLLVDTTTGETSTTGMRGSARWLQGTAFTVLGTPQDGLETSTGLYRLDVNDLTPTLLLPVLGELRLLDYQVLANGMIRALIQNQSPGEIRIVDLQADGSGATLISNAGYMIAPTLSADGSVVIGQTVPGGALLVFDLTSGARFMIDTLPQVTFFRWQQASR